MGSLLCFLNGCAPSSPPLTDSVAPPRLPARAESASPPLLSSQPASPPAPTPHAAAASQETENAPEALRCFARHYGGAAKKYDEQWVLEFDEDTRFAFDDREKKTIEQVFTSPDLQDTLARYPRSFVPSRTKARTDAGRIRHGRLLRQRYGHTSSEVRDSLERVSLNGSDVSVHHLVAPALRKVSKQLDQLAKNDPKVRLYLSELGGGFSWRRIAGTARLSPHSFGIAIDLNPKKSAYWRWTSDWDGSFPRAIVEAFESEGFIWGGVWEHFDSMHFEFRPELFDPECAPEVR